MNNVQVHGADLKRGLTNLLGLTVFPATMDVVDRAPCTYILLETTRMNPQGALVLIRATPYLWCVQEVPLVDNGSKVEYGSMVSVVTKAKQKTDILDDLTKLKTAITGPLTNKKATLSVELVDSERFTVMDSTSLVGELAEANGTPTVVDTVLGALNGAQGRIEPLTMFNTAMLAQFKGVKTSASGSKAPNVDLGKLVRYDAVVFNIGGECRGILSIVDRDLYALGGPWGDGPGEQLHLLDM